MKASLPRMLVISLVLIGLAGCQSNNMGLGKLGWSWPQWKWGKKETAVASNAPASNFNNAALPSQMAGASTSPAGYGYGAATGYQGQIPAYGAAPATTGATNGQYAGTGYGQQSPYTGAYANNAAGAAYGQTTQTAAPTGAYGVGGAYDTQSAGGYTAATTGGYPAQSGYTGGYNQPTANPYAQQAASAPVATGGYQATSPQSSYTANTNNAASSYAGGYNQNATSRYNAPSQATATAGGYAATDYRSQQQPAAAPTAPASQYRSGATGSTYQPGNTGYNPPGVPPYQPPYNSTPYTQTAPSSNHQGGAYRPGGTTDYAPSGGTTPAGAGGIQPAGYDQSPSSGAYLNHNSAHAPASTSGQTRTW